MSKGKALAIKANKPTKEEIRRAKAAAAEKARKAREEALKIQMKKDQVWLDENSKTMSDDEKDELFRQASRKCKNTTMKDGKIIVACPLPRKLEYCVNADPFTCPNGKADTAQGCKLSSAASQALKNDTTCIDGAFVSNAEGGSYLSPYVPWGPVSGADEDGSPILTTGNSSGVTIGTGVDLGAISDETKYLKRLEDAGVSQETRDRIKPFLGKKRADACKALREAKIKGPLILPQKDVELIDIDAMKSRVPELEKQFESARLKRVKNLNAQIKREQAKKKTAPDQAKIKAWQDEINSISGFSDISCSQQTVLFSTLYHEGRINKTHSKPFVDALLEGDNEGARNALEQKTKNKNKLIAARGKRELSYLDEQCQQPCATKP